MKVVRGKAGRVLAVAALVVGLMSLAASGTSAGTLSSLTPVCGVAGSVVHLSGSGSTGATGVLFGAIPEPFGVGQRRRPGDGGGAPVGLDGPRHGGEPPRRLG
jgi:hypothetical protein